MTTLTILMPTDNIICNDAIISQALDSLLNQTFIDFEIKIMTNDFDNLPEVFKLKDVKINFISSNEAENIKSKYFMVANCDDLWNKYYIEELLKVFKRNKNIDLAYSNGAFITSNSKVGDCLLTNISFDYTFDKEENFCYGIQYRTAIPTLHGIFKTNSFDVNNIKLDNLFLCKFLLDGYTAKLCNQKLFYYRDGKIDSNIKIDNTISNSVLLWLFHLKQELKFYNKAIQIIPENRKYLKLVAFDSCLRQSHISLLWITKDLTQDKFEQSILEVIDKKYEVINQLLFQDIYPEFTKDLYRNTFRKIDALNKKIFPFIDEAINPHPLIDHVVKQIKDVDNNIKEDEELL